MRSSDASLYPKDNGGDIIMLLCHLQDIMEKQKISQKQISQITKIRTQTIANLRNNKIKQIPVDAAEKLCEFLDCNMGDLFEYKKD